MKIKILHTADNHIGMKFSGYPDAARETLVAERLAALENIVNAGNEGESHFLVIAGDLFDSVNVRLADLKAVAGILHKFQGEAVLILPGNHDFYESSADSLWEKFKKLIKPEKIQVLSEYKKEVYQIGEQKVAFYPCSCRSKHSPENAIGWVSSEAKDETVLNIGIAHGNVDGLGLDNADRYFNMAPGELKSAALDFWLLGHIHVPYPSTSVDENPVFFMSGTHTPDGWDRKHEGYCFGIDVEENKKVAARLIPTGNIRFYDWEREIHSDIDIEKLMAEIKSLNGNKSVVRIALSGRLAATVLQQFRASLELLKKEFLHLAFYDSMKEDINEEFINAHYPKNSFPQLLLSSLLSESDEGLSIQLANDLIETNKK